jgi:glycosyltransferase involved in cell wall biosynthesis
MPHVSVILNCYNHAAYVAQAIESVLNQTYQDYELIAIDNGSTDESSSVLRRFAGHPRVRLLVHKDNDAITKRLNEGIARAAGEYISFLYSDDYYLPTKLERQVACFATLSADYGVVYGPSYFVNDVTGKRWRGPTFTASGSILKDMFLKYEQGHIVMIAPLTRRECLLRHPFYEDIFAEGEGIFYRIAQTHKFHYLDEPLVVMRDHLSNAGKALERNAAITFARLDRLEASPEFPPPLRRYLRYHRAVLHRNYGWQGVRLGGDVAWARRRLAESVKLRGQNALHPRVFLGFGLSFLPGSVRRSLNAVANAVRRHPTNNIYRAAFGGAADN